MVKVMVIIYRYWIVPSYSLLVTAGNLSFPTLSNHPIVLSETPDWTPSPAATPRQTGRPWVSTKASWTAATRTTTATRWQRCHSWAWYNNFRPCSKHLQISHQGNCQQQQALTLRWHLGTYVLQRRRLRMGRLVFTIMYLPRSQRLAHYVRAPNWSWYSWLWPRNKQENLQQTPRPLPKGYGGHLIRHNGNSLWWLGQSLNNGNAPFVSWSNRSVMFTAPTCLNMSTASRKSVASCFPHVAQLGFLYPLHIVYVELRLDFSVRRLRYMFSSCQFGFYCPLRIVYVELMV
jgi:hypothetical protein